MVRRRQNDFTNIEMIEITGNANIGPVEQIQSGNAAPEEQKSELSMRSIGQYRADIGPNVMTEEQQADVDARRLAQRAIENIEAHHQVSEEAIDAIGGEQPPPPHLPRNMSVELIAQVEARRLAEAENHDEERNHRVQIYKREVKNSITWNSVILVLFILRGFGQNAEQLKFFSKELPNIYYFFVLDCTFYFLTILFQSWIYKKLKNTNLKLFRSIDSLKYLAFFIFGLWGQTQMGSDEFQKIKREKAEGKGQEQQKFRDFINILAMMVWLRVIFVYIMFPCLCIFVCLYFCGFDRERDSQQSQMEQYASRIPVINLFLKNKAHNYTPEDRAKNPDNCECVICFDEFQVDDGKEIVELDCNDKHVFHLKCIEQWVQKNDTCPICRQKIQEGK